MEKKNKDKVRKSNQNWYYLKNGKEKKKEYDKNRLSIVRERDNKRYNEDIQYRLNKILRTRLKKTLKNEKKEKSTKELIDCSYEDLIEWVSYQFNDKMSWKNYNEYWNIDHVIPCSSFDLEKISEQEKCYHWSNLRPMIAIENYKKGNKIIISEIENHKDIVKKWIQIKNISVPKWF